MRVVHIAYWYGLNNTGGACMAATRLHLALLRQGVDSHYVCCRQEEQGPNVYELPARGFMRVVQYVVTRIVWLLGYITPERRVVMPNLVPLLSLGRTLRRIRPDVVHVHWYMMDTMSFGQLAGINSPVVMTLHDLFDVNIEEPYPAKDRRFIEGVSSQNSNWLERWLFGRKCKAMRCKRPTLVGPSRWICDMASSSIIGRGMPCSVVPNVMDASFSFGIEGLGPRGRFRVLFGAKGGRSNPLKGWDDLVEAIHCIDPADKNAMEVLVFGESGEPYLEDGVQIRFLGPLNTPIQVRDACCSADVLALPSREDNAPNVKFEAWLCGLPVVAFERTGCAEGIEQGKNGFVARDGDCAGFAAGLCYFKAKSTSPDYVQFRRGIAESSSRKYDERSVVAKIMEVYKTVCVKK